MACSSDRASTRSVADEGSAGGGVTAGTLCCAKRLWDRDADSLKRTGIAAREEMEALFDARIYLDLHVKVEPDWRGKAR